MDEFAVASYSEYAKVMKRLYGEYTESGSLIVFRGQTSEHRLPDGRLALIPSAFRSPPPALKPTGLMPAVTRYLERYRRCDLQGHRPKATSRSARLLQPGRGRTEDQHTTVCPIARDGSHRGGEGHELDPQRDRAVVAAPASGCRVNLSQAIHQVTRRVFASGKPPLLLNAYFPEVREPVVLAEDAVWRDEPALPNHIIARS